MEISKSDRDAYLDLLYDMYDADLVDAGRWLKDIKKCRHIAQVCNGVRKTAYGYKWAWLKDFQQDI